MENFKEIAEKCLAGELKGTFKNAKGENIPSKALCRVSSKTYPYAYNAYYSVTTGGYFFKSGKFSDYDIIDFIPDNMQKKIEIDIPEGKVPVMEQTENGVVIAWKDKELTYDDIESKLNCCISSCGFLSNKINFTFYKKVEVIRKLINIRNNFGGDKPTNSWIITIDSALKPFAIKSLKPYRETCFIYFDTEEHAQAAIKMLGDELKYLFEPW